MQIFEGFKLKNYNLYDLNWIKKVGCIEMTLIKM